MLATIVNLHKNLITKKKTVQTTNVCGHVANQSFNVICVILCVFFFLSVNNSRADLEQVPKVTLFSSVLF